MKQPGVKVLHGLIWICIWIYVVYGLNFVIMFNPICDDDLCIYICTFIHVLGWGWVESTNQNIMIFLLGFFSTSQGGHSGFVTSGSSKTS